MLVGKAMEMAERLKHIYPCKKAALGKNESFWNN